jgi:YHS domain-containing protein
MATGTFLSCLFAMEDSSILHEATLMEELTSHKEGEIEPAWNKVGAIRDFLSTMGKQHTLHAMFFGLLVASAVFLASAAIVAQEASRPIYVDGRGFAVGGFDVVEYFRANEAKRGSPSFATTYRGANFLFVSAENRDAFLGDPGQYVPQFGAYCAYAMSQGTLRKCDPRRFSVRDGKLYLFSSNRVRKRWLSREADLLATAISAWRSLFR